MQRVHNIKSATILEFVYFNSLLVLTNREHTYRSEKMFNIKLEGEMTHTNTDIFYVFNKDRTSYLLTLVRYNL